LKEADLVVIATPVQTQAVADSFRSLSWNATFRGVETAFKARAVVKDKVDGSKFTLLHYRFESDPGECFIFNGPLLVSFQLPEKDRLIETRDGWKSQVDYMLFLKKRADGRYEAVSGQIDPGLAVRKLIDVRAELRASR
jgi:hypothetical protein